jgi:hypothetical protein
MLESRISLACFNLTMIPFLSFVMHISFAGLLFIMETPEGLNHSKKTLLHMMRDGLGALRFPIREPIQHGDNNQPTTRIQHYSGLLFLPSVMHPSPTQSSSPGAQTKGKAPEDPMQSLVDNLMSLWNRSQESEALKKGGQNISDSKTETTKTPNASAPDSLSPEQKKQEAIVQIAAGIQSLLA